VISRVVTGRNYSLQPTPILQAILTGPLTMDKNTALDQLSVLQVNVSQLP